MAVPVVKTTSTVNVIVQDSNNGDTTFKLDNPKDGLTLSDVKGVFDNWLFNYSDVGNLLCTKQGYEIISVVGAEKVTTVITRETLDS